MGPDTAAPPPGDHVSRTDALLGVAALGTEHAVVAGRLVARVLAPGVRVALDPPLVPHRLHPRRAWVALAARGRTQRLATREALRRMLDSLAPILVDRALDLVPLTTVIREHVDLDALVAGVDLDAVVSRVDVEAVLARLDLTEVVTERVDLDAVAEHLDVEAIIDRVDLVALAREVIVAIDLPEIIRESSGSLVNESVRGVRMQSIDADRAVERLVDRVLRRHGTPGPDSPERPPEEAP